MIVLIFIKILFSPRSYSVKVFILEQISPSLVIILPYVVNPFSSVHFIS